MNSEGFELNWKSFLLLVVVCLAWYGGYKGYKPHFERAFNKWSDAKTIDSDNAYEACWTVCYEQQIETIRAAFDAKVLEHEKAQELLSIMETDCKVKCSNKLGIQ